jgi:hypothetical protein
MIKIFQRYSLPSLIALSALSVSASAAFYSVSGLSKLFAGASFEVIIMASSLEISKLVIASLLYQYWDTLNKFLRTYLTVAAGILVLITSMGIYGFLSAAYQETYAKLSIVENQKSFIEKRIDIYQKDLANLDTQLESQFKIISNASNAQVREFQVTDSINGEKVIRKTISTAEIRAAEQRSNLAQLKIEDIDSKRKVVTDSLQKLQLQVLDLENSTEVAGELGPLQYLSGLTGTPMDKIINILLLVIIFVFDPLAISLVIAANFAFDQAKPKKNLYGEIEDDFSDWDDLDEEEPNDNLKKAADRYKEKVSEEEVIEELDPKEIEVIEPEEVKPTVEDWRVVDEQDKEILDKKVVKRILQKGPSRHRVQYEDGSEGYVRKDDNTIRYL